MLGHSVGLGCWLACPAHGGEKEGACTYRTYCCTVPIVFFISHPTSQHSCGDHRAQHILQLFLPPAL